MLHAVFRQIQGYLGQTKLTCWSTGPTDPILSKNRKLQSFERLAFFNILFSAFWRK